MKNIIIKPFIFVFVWLIVVLKGFADESFVVNGFTYKVNQDDSSIVDLIHYQPVPDVDYSQPLHIQSSVTHDGKTYSVVHIRNGAFFGVTEVQKIVIDEGVENIGLYVFECCTNLKSIYIPASVYSVGEGIFGSCYNLTSVVVDAKNEDYDSRDGSNAIIATSDNELVAACSSTKIPSSVKIIGNKAFYYCNLMEELIIPEGVEKIDHKAFYGCTSLRSINLPKSLTEFGADVFEGCNSLTSVFIPKNVIKFNKSSNIFDGCNHLTSIVVDDANPYYDSRSNCNGIVRKSDSTLIATCQTTTISDDISALGNYCFSGINVHSINIPSSVVKISETAFLKCIVFDEITVAADNPVYMSPNGSNAILSKDGKTLLCGCRNTIIPSSVETIGAYAFYGRYGNQVLRIPDTVKAIESFAFSNCNYLNEIIIPESVESLSSSAFSECLNLYSVHILSSLKELAPWTFLECHKLSVVSLSEGLDEISSYAFSGCRSLKYITIPSSVTIIYDNAFKDCENLKHVTILSNETIIDDQAFNGCPYSEKK